MSRFFLRAGVGILGFAVTCVRLQANDLFVAPGGTPFGPGTLAQPYDVVTAFSGDVGQPGDTFWLRGGDYQLGHLDTQIQGAPGKPITFRQVSGEHARIDGSLTVFDSLGYVVFRDFELYSSDTNRVSAQTNAGFNVTDITLLTGFSSYTPNLSFINLVVHDATREGIYLFEGSTNTLIYGCIVYNNGWVSPNNAEGHGLYVQGDVGMRTVADNIVFNNSGASLHVYENSNGGSLYGVTLDGNVAFNAGAIQQVRPYRDWIVGVDSPSLYADRIVLENNMGFVARGASTYPQLQIGRDGTNGNVILTNNYMQLGLQMNNWRSATVSENLFAPRWTNYVVNLNQTLTPLNAEWDNNIYIFDPPGPAVSLDFGAYTFSDWQQMTGFDLDSTFVVGDLHGTKAFVRPNLYQAGRANIIVYNWDNLSNVVVDVSSVLPMNSGFEVRNAEDFEAAPVLSGVFTGQRLLLPMTNLTVAVPNVPTNGPLAAAPPTGPTFNVFVLLPLTGQLHITNTGGSDQVYWPVGAGPGALQTAPSLTGNWTDYPNTPVMVHDQFMITDASSSTQKFYRLRPQ